MGPFQNAYLFVDIMLESLLKVQVVETPALLQTDGV